MENFPKPNIRQKVQENIKPETKEYRDGLAEDLKTLRDINPETAQEFLSTKQETVKYKNTQEDISTSRNSVLESEKRRIDIAQETIKRIEEGEGYDVLKSLSSIEDLNSNDILDSLIDNGYAEGVVQRLNQFEGVDKNALAERLINSNQIKAIVYEMDKFDKFPGDAIYKFMEAGYIDYAIGSIDQFENVNEEEVAKTVIEKYPDGIFYLARYADKYPSIDNEETVRLLIANGYTYEIARNLDSFHNTNHRKIVSQIMDLGETRNRVVEHISNFDEGTHEYIVDRVIKSNNHVEDLIKRLQFIEIDHRKFAKKCIDAGYGELVLRYANVFKEISKDELEKMISI